MEQSDHQAKKIEQQNGAGSSADTSQESFSDLNKIRSNKFQHKSKQGINTGSQRNTQQRQQCGRCVMINHKSKDCRVTKGKKCMNCGIMGHFAKYCKTKTPKKSKSHEVKTESSSDDESFVFKIESKERPVYPVNMNGTPIKMFIDTGSTLTLSSLGGLNQPPFWFFVCRFFQVHIQDQNFLSFSFYLCHDRKLIF